MTRFVYRLTHSQQMALCAFLADYVTECSKPNSTLAEECVDFVTGKEVHTTPADLLAVFLNVGERVTLCGD